MGKLPSEQLPLQMMHRLDDNSTLLLQDWYTPQLYIICPTPHWTGTYDACISPTTSRGSSQCSRMEDLQRNSSNRHLACSKESSH